MTCFDPRAFQWIFSFGPKIMAFKKRSWSLLISMVLRNHQKTTGNKTFFAWANTFELKMLKFRCFLKQKRRIGTRILKKCHWSLVI